MMLLAVCAVSASKMSEPCGCGDDKCTILPPKDTTAPCYEGSNTDTDNCFATDPLLVDGATKQCGACSDFGYSNYLRNDPLYKSMSLYGLDATVKEEVKAGCGGPNDYCVPGDDSCCSGTCPYTWQMTCSGAAKATSNLKGTVDPPTCTPKGGYCVPGDDTCCSGTCPYTWLMQCN